MKPDPRRCAILSPVYNDWRSFKRLVQAIDACELTRDHRVDIIAIDDGSIQDDPADRLEASGLTRIAAVNIIRLACNLGHQRAIAIGLAHAAHLAAYDFVIVMDSDGEDRPEDLAALAQRHQARPGSIIVGQRARRSEGTLFRGFYQLYKRSFTLITGRKVDFGNFCLIPGAHLTRITHMPELWNHLAATIIRSKVPFERVPTRRGLRYFGRSSMSFISLTMHGLSGMAAFSDVLFVRLLVASMAVMGLGVAAALVATIIRLFTGLAIPGWATEVVGLAAIVILQGFTLSITAAFMTLSNRTSLVFVPAINGPAYIDRIDEVKAGSDVSALQGG